jgi:hypothetical protein
VALAVQACMGGECLCGFGGPSMHVRGVLVWLWRSKHAWEGSACVALAVQACELFALVVSMGSGTLGL